MKSRDVVAAHHRFVFARESGQMKWRCGNDIVTIVCHEGRVPAYVENELARLYGSLYSSIPLLRVYDSLRGLIHTFVMRRNGQPDAVFLARIRAGVLVVINEGMRVSAQQIRLFSNYVFSRYPTIAAISLCSVELPADFDIAYPHQRYEAREDIVVELPASTETYHASLGKNVRRNLRRYGERLRRDHPDYVHEVVDGGAVDEEDVRTIIRLNVERMASKNKVSAYDDAETARLVDLTRRCGLVGIARIRGRVCGGALSFRTGDNYALSVLAHDPEFNDYSLGMLCAYQIICECIVRGAREFHFLWGRYEYKFLLRGREHTLQNLSIYRSRMQMLLHADLAAHNRIESAKRHLAVWMHDASHRQGGAANAARLLTRLRSAWRAARSRAQR